MGVEDEDERGGGGRHFVVRRMKSPGTIINRRWRDSPGGHPRPIRNQSMCIILNGYFGFSTVTIQGHPQNVSSSAPHTLLRPHALPHHRHTIHPPPSSRPFFDPLSNPTSTPRRLYHRKRKRPCRNMETCLGQASRLVWELGPLQGKSDPSETLANPCTDTPTNPYPSYHLATCSSYP